MFDQERDEKSEEVHRVKAGATRRQAVDARLVADDKEDAAVPERAEQVRNPSAPRGGLHEGVPGLR